MPTSSRLSRSHDRGVRRATDAFSLNIEDDFGDPLGANLVEAEPMTRRGFHLVVKNVTRSVDWFAADFRIEPEPGLINDDVEPGIQPVLRLAEVDELVEPQKEELIERVGCEADTFSVLNLNVAAIGDDDIEKTLAGSLEEVRQIGRRDANSEIRGMFKRFATAHGSSSSRDGSDEPRELDVPGHDH